METENTLAARMLREYVRICVNEHTEHATADTRRKAMATALAPVVDLVDAVNFMVGRFESDDNNFSQRTAIRKVRAALVNLGASP